MPAPTAIPEPGQLVRVRYRHVVVLEVQGADLPPDASSGEDARPQHLVSLSPVEDDALGEKLRAFCELERRAVIHEHAGLQQPKGFDLDWQELPDARACRIATWYPHASTEDENRWEEYLDWLTQRLVKMDQVLRPIVKALP